MRSTRTHTLEHRDERRVRRVAAAITPREMRNWRIAPKEGGTCPVETLRNNPEAGH